MTTKKSRIAVTVETEIFDDLAALAELRGISLSRVVNELLESASGRHRKQRAVLEEALLGRLHGTLTPGERLAIRRTGKVRIHRTGASDVRPSPPMPPPAPSLVVKPLNAWQEAKRAAKSARRGNRP